MYSKDSCMAIRLPVNNTVVSYKSYNEYIKSIYTLSTYVEIKWSETSCDITNSSLPYTVFLCYEMLKLIVGLK